MSSSDLAIRVRGLCKSYSIRHEAKRNVESTLAETVLKRLRSPLGRTGETETFHALKDVDFDVKKGDVVGVIGRNGAGKSTLLKILSRITEPTSGRIELYGRIGSLLEVGTGFHPELTGRENIYLNGAILGMSRGEIRKQFDAIVDFAGVEQFLDTPVKRYSSGMYVRLAFAVAAHLQSEILIVDEVLAVGDAEFQRKCLGKMKDVASGGRTVLFVSHHAASVQALCKRVILLQHGLLRYAGSTEEGLQLFRDSTPQSEDLTPAIAASRRGGTGEYRFAEMRASKAAFRPDEQKSFAFKLRRNARYDGIIDLIAVVHDDLGQDIAQLDSRLLAGSLSRVDSISGMFVMETPWLRPGSYTVSMYACGATAMDEALHAISFVVSSDMPYPDASDPRSFQHGIVLPDFQINLEQSSVVG